MSEELTLLPCPACGEKDLSVDEHIYDRYGLISPWWTVICPNCGLSVGEKCKSSPQAIDAWNALPRALTWTDEPQLGAWNWWRDEDSRIPRYVYQDGTVDIAMQIDRVPYQDLGGQWCPITEPREPK